ncbi:MAG TPA: CBS domain-containing protein [Steroidobacteraceae bacterium]
MSVGTICTRHAITIDRDIRVAAAAALMLERGVGYLVVTDATRGDRKPVGVVTDRDLVIKVIARNADPQTLKVGDVMTPEPLVAAFGDTIARTLNSMRVRGVRRVPVIGLQGNIAGVLSLDDVFGHLVNQLADVAGSIHRQQPTERQIYA